MPQHSPARSHRVAVLVATAAALLATPVSAAAEPRPDRVARVETSNDDTPDRSVVTDADASDELLDACPLHAASTFEDSWGWARSGGRSHEGVDMIAARGAPVIAVRDGDAHFKRNSLGGNAVWLTASNGDKFYYAHLDAFSGESRTVEARELIGFVGSTGNAQGPHLHFETLPGGEVENPYPHTLAACVPTLDEVTAIFEAEANVLNDPAVWGRFIPAS